MTLNLFGHDNIETYVFEEKEIPSIKRIVIV